MAASDTVCGGASDAALPLSVQNWLPFVGPSPAASIGPGLDAFAGPGSDVSVFPGPEVSTQTLLNNLIDIILVENTKQ